MAKLGDSINKGDFTMANYPKGVDLNDLSTFDRLDTPTLEELLAVLFLSKDSPNMELIEYISDILEKRAPLISNRKWRSIDKKILKSAGQKEDKDKADCEGSPDPKADNRFRFLIRHKALSMSLAVIVILTVTVFALPAASGSGFESLFKWTGEVFSNAVKFIYHQRVSQNAIDGNGGEGQISVAAGLDAQADIGIEARDFSTLDAAVSYSGIEMPALGSLPEGAEIKSIQYSNEPEAKELLIYYSDGARDFYLSGRIAEYAQINAGDPGSEYTFMAGSVAHYVTTNGKGKYYKAIWEDGEIEYALWGEVAQPELEAMINSIYERSD